MIFNYNVSKYSTPFNMLIYSESIARFINKIKNFIRIILSKEMNIKVHGYRFYHSRFSYPLKVVIFNNKNIHGYFESDFLELGFHESLMHVKDTILCDVIRHELAHYLTFIEWGAYIQSHGKEFKECCLRYGWGESVSSATTCHETEENTNDNFQEHDLLRKIKKLLALAGSSNMHEAELAMLKSQQLLLKHNLDVSLSPCETEDKFFLKRIYKQPKQNAKMDAIARILETFFVSVIYNRSKNYTMLEILGNQVNVEIAEYVACVLDKELDLLWEQNKKLHVQLKGQIAKNSFFRGIAIGYCKKVKGLEAQLSPNNSSALVVVKNKLTEAKAFAYSNLNTVKSRSGYCSNSAALGELIGKSLVINTAIQSNSSKNTLTLTKLN